MPIYYILKKRTFLISCYFTEYIFASEWVSEPEVGSSFSYTVILYINFQNMDVYLMLLLIFSELLLEEIF
jgi:hypothetical protein